MSKKGRRISVTVPPELFELAKIIGCPPARILENFTLDLLRLPGSSGSDEREMAGEYFLRTNMACDRYEAIADYISISRTEYRCQICQQWVRQSDLRYVGGRRPYFVCRSHGASAVIDTEDSL